MVQMFAITKLKKNSRDSPDMLNGKNHILYMQKFIRSKIGWKNMIHHLSLSIKI